MLFTHRDYAMEYNAIIVSAFCELEKVFACLEDRRKCYSVPAVTKMAKESAYPWSMVPVQFQLDITQTCLQYN